MCCQSGSTSLLTKCNLTVGKSWPADQSLVATASLCLCLQCVSLSFPWSSVIPWKCFSSTTTSSSASRSRCAASTASRSSTSPSESSYLRSSLSPEACRDLIGSAKAAAVHHCLASVSLLPSCNLWPQFLLEPSLNNFDIFSRRYLFKLSFYTERFSFEGLFLLNGRMHTLILWMCRWHIWWLM